jgi:hypothetical protein
MALAPPFKDEGVADFIAVDEQPSAGRCEAAG